MAAGKLCGTMDVDPGQVSDAMKYVAATRATRRTRRPEKSKNNVDTFQRAPLKGQSTLSAVALAKADTGTSKKINREKIVEATGRFDKRHHLVPSFTHEKEICSVSVF
jgi:hypothetical protein